MNHKEIVPYFFLKSAFKPRNAKLWASPVVNQKLKIEIWQEERGIQTPSSSSRWSNDRTSGLVDSAP